MSYSKKNTDNFWSSSAEDDVKPRAHNPYKETPRGRGGNYGNGGRGRGPYHPPRPINPYTEKIKPEPFDEMTQEIVSKIINHEDPNITISEMDFGDINDPRENYRARLYVLAQRGKEYYQGKRSQLARRWQFESEDRLIELMNDPEKLKKEVMMLNATQDAAPSVNEFSPLNDFPQVLGEDILYGIGSSSDDKDQMRTYQLTGIRKILARCCGTTDRERRFYESIVRVSNAKLNDFYNKPNRFIEAVWGSQACPPWDPVQLPQEELKKAAKKTTEKKPPLKPPNAPTTPLQNGEEEKNSGTPKKSGTTDVAKALHKPNTVLKLDIAKLAVMSPGASNKFIKEVSKSYFDEYYGGHERFFQVLDQLNEKELFRAILNDGEMQRLAKVNGINPIPAQPQTPSERAMLMKNPTEYSYVLQCARTDAKDTSAAATITPVYEVFHRIINSFDCTLGLEPVHNPTEARTIYEPEVVFQMLDERYTTSIVKENYKDTLHFNFRLRTRADIINMLGRVKDYNIDGTKSLVAFLKENHLQLYVLWKSPVSFQEVVMITGATKYSDLEKSLREIVYFLNQDGKAYENSQLELNWKRKSMDDVTRYMLVLSTDPSISKDVAMILMERSSDMNPSEYQEIYDFRYFLPCEEEDEESYRMGIESQGDFIEGMTCAILSGIRHNLFRYTPHTTSDDHKWADDQNIYDKLIANDEALYAEDSHSRESPFIKLHCTGKGWVITWHKDSDEVAKTYLRFHFAKDMAYWTKEEYHSIGVKYPLEQDPESEDDTKSAPAEQASMQDEEDADSEVRADEFGRAIRKEKENTEKQTGTAPTELTSQTNSRDMTSNASSSLTAQTMRQYAQGNGYGGWAYPPGTLPTYPYTNSTYQIPNNGQIMDLQQFGQLLKVIENQTEMVMTHKLGTALAFYDPAKGIKSMFMTEMNALHNTIRNELAMNRTNSATEKKKTIPRVKSLNDVGTVETITIERNAAQAKSTAQATSTSQVTLSAPITGVTGADTSEKNEMEIPRGSFAPTFNPYPEPRPKAANSQATQSVGNGTPIGEVLHPPTPTSYRGPIREMGDAVIKALDQQLKTAEESAELTENQESSSAEELNPEEDNKSNEEASGQPSEDDSTMEPMKLRPRRLPQSQCKLNEQTPPETTTGDPPPSTKPGKASRKNS
jgi:hypothetical protein